MDDVRAVAARTGLRPPRDSINEPWRYWVLRYLAALAAIADFEGTHFGHAEAAAALETLRDAVNDMLIELPMRRRRR